MTNQTTNTMDNQHPGCVDILEKCGIDPTINFLFVSKKSNMFGTPAYFRESMAAGFYGTDDGQRIAFTAITA